MQEGAGRWAGSNKVVELKKKKDTKLHTYTLKKENILFLIHIDLISLKAVK